MEEKEGLMRGHLQAKAGPRGQEEEALLSFHTLKSPPSIVLLLHFDISLTCSSLSLHLSCTSEKRFWISVSVSRFQNRVNLSKGHRARL